MFIELDEVKKINKEIKKLVKNYKITSSIKSRPPKKISRDFGNKELPMKNKNYKNLRHFKSFHSTNFEKTYFKEEMKRLNTIGSFRLKNSKSLGKKDYDFSTEGRDVFGRSTSITDFKFTRFLKSEEKSVKFKEEKLETFESEREKSSQLEKRGRRGSKISCFSKRSLKRQKSKYLITNMFKARLKTDVDDKIIDILEKDNKKIDDLIRTIKSDNKTGGDILVRN